MIRLFAAVVPPQDIAQALAARQEGFAGARWRERDSLHVTLSFFGSMAETRAEDLAAELSVIGGGAFDLTVAGVGTFQTGDAPHALWAGVAHSPPLARLAARCETAARRAGLMRERRVYRPHITLAYLDRPDGARLAAWVQAHNLLRSPPFRVDRFGLYSSWGGEAGRAYRLERAYPLA